MPIFSSFNKCLIRTQLSTSFEGDIIINSSTTNILIIEDSWLESSLLKDFLNSEFKKIGHSTQISLAQTESRAYKILSEDKFDLVVFDIDLDRRGAGFQLLERFSKNIPFSVISSCRQSEEAVALGYKYGCEHFLQKPIKEKNIKLLVEDFRKKIEHKDLISLIKSKYITDDSFTTSELKKILTCADLSTHLTGPTGVGKQVIAELIHETHRNSAPFIERNCSSFSDALADSLLFGHKAGSFTGATEDRKGVFELANGGTIFLDEIDKTSKSFQAKLLKIIEQKQIVRVGSESTIQVNFHLITASSQNLEKLAETGDFLPDLWERLQGEVIHLPGLSERPQDIEIQLRHFIRTHESGRLFIISKEAQHFLNHYSWPGNTRELKQLVNRFQKKNTKILDLKDIEFLKQKNIRTSNHLLNTNILKSVQGQGLNSTIQTLTKEIVNHYYIKNKMKKRTTMRELEISCRTLYKHLEQIEMDQNAR